jgi:hypothetical protein
LLCGRAGFSKIDDLCEIVNYLPASLEYSAPANSAKLGHVLLVWMLAWTPKPPSGFPSSFPTRPDISAQRNQAVAREGIEYVLGEFISIECNAL